MAYLTITVPRAMAWAAPNIQSSPEPAILSQEGSNSCGAVPPAPPLAKKPAMVLRAREEVLGSAA